MGANNDDIWITKLDDTTVEATVYGNTQEYSRLHFDFPMLAEVLDEGPAEVGIDPMDSTLSPGIYRFAYSGITQIYVSIDQKKEFENEIILENIRFLEDRVISSDYKLALELPIGFEWVDYGSFKGLNRFKGGIAKISEDKRTLEVTTISRQSNFIGTLILEWAKIKVTPEARYGQVNVKIIGEHVANDTLTVGFYKDPNYIVEIAAGSNHTVALKSDGTVIAWGDNTYGQCDVPHNLKDVVSISAGANHTVALKADGTIVVWGNNRYGQCDVPWTLKDAILIASGDNHIVATKSDGTIVAWGYNAYEQCNVKDKPKVIIDNSSEDDSYSPPSKSNKTDDTIIKKQLNNS